MSGLLGTLSDMFAASTPQTPPPGGMTFEQRAALIGALYMLKARHDRTVEAWRYMIIRTLSYAEATRPLADVAASEVEKDNEAEEQRLTYLVTLSLSLAELHPVAAFGGDVRYLISEEVENAIAKSGPVRFFRWTAPIFAALIFGGAVWGGMQIEGIREAARRTQHDIESQRNEMLAAVKADKAEVDLAAATANKDIAAISGSIAAGWRAQLQAEAQSELKDLHNVVENAKAAALPQVKTEESSIADWGKSQRAVISGAIDAEKASLDQLGPKIDAALTKATETIGEEVRKSQAWADEEYRKLQTKEKEEQDVVAGDLDRQKATILSEMSDRAKDVANAQILAKQQFDLLVQNVRTGQSDMQKTQEGLQARENALEAKLSGLEEVVKQSNNLQAVVDRADRKGIPSFGMLIELLLWKDIVIGIVGSIALAAFAMSVIAYKRRAA